MGTVMGAGASRVKIAYPVDALVSFHYYRDDDDMGPLAATGRLRLIGDSGAYSALTQGVTIGLAEYAAWVQRWRPHLFWAASLDVIGDPEATWRNWTALRERYGTDTVPTIHAGTDPAWLDRYATQGVDLVGLGGMVALGTRAFRWTVAMLRYARDRWPDVRFHLWGITHREYLAKLPIYSADSSGALGAAYRYARLKVFDPSTGRHHNVLIQGGNAVYRLAPLLRRVYGVTPAEIATSHPGNRTTLIRLAAASTQQYAAWLRRIRTIPAPVRSVNPAAPPGPRVHVVAGTNQAAGRTDLDAVVNDDQPGGAASPATAAPGGPLIHCAMATAGRTQADEVALTANPGDPTTPADPGGSTAADGPRIHLVDAVADHLNRLTTQEDQ